MAREFYRKGYSIHVMAHEKGTLLEKCIEEKLPCTAINLHKLTFLNPFRIHFLSQKISALAPKSVILNLPSDMKAGGLAAKKAGVKKIFYRRGSALPVNAHPINRYVFKNLLSGIITNSEKTKSLINEKGNLINKNKVFVVYNGVSVPDKWPQENSQSPFVIGNAGRLVYQKGQDYLVKLAKILQTETQDFKIRIAGEGPLRASLAREIEKQELSEFVQLTGFQNNMENFYNSLDVFLLPSRWEGFGYAMVEAMFYRLPVIAFNVSSNPEIIKDRENGFLFPFNDLEGMKNKIMELINNRTLCRDIGKNAEAYAREKFSMKRSAEQLESVLNLL